MVENANERVARAWGMKSVPAVQQPEPVVEEKQPVEQPVKEQVKYVAIPRAVSIEEMLNVINDKLDVLIERTSN